MCWTLNASVFYAVLGAGVAICSVHHARLYPRRTSLAGRPLLEFRAPHSVCPVFTVRDRLSVSPSGSGGYMVFPEQNCFQSNRVNLRWGESSDDHVYDCSCRWCPRWKMPCRHVLAAAEG